MLATRPQPKLGEQLLRLLQGGGGTARRGVATVQEGVQADAAVRPRSAARRRAAKICGSWLCPTGESRPKHCTARRGGGPVYGLAVGGIR